MSEVASAIAQRPGLDHPQPRATAAPGINARWMQTRLNYVCVHHSLVKPKHRAVSAPLPDGGGGHATFVLGRFLSDVAEYFLDGRQAALGEAGKRLAEQALWFRPWVDKLRVRRAGAATRGEPPDDDEQLAMLVAASPTSRPSRSATLTTVRRNGEEHELSVRQVYEHLSAWLARRDAAASRPGRRVVAGEPVHYSRATLEAFLALPWARKWVKESSMQRHAAHTRKVVTKELKIELLLLNCRDTQPVWDQVLPVCGPGIVGVYEWRPATWLDDIGNNWLGGAAPGVRLNVPQMKAIETLSWVSSWLIELRRSRARRAQRV
jgi:hypothetical protein